MNNAIITNEKKLEQIKALGFNSIEECEDHQEWLNRMNNDKNKIRSAIEASNGSGIIDLRNID